jgi:catechol 2,3-dioxygenase-like lactoylglutathione lyase family enzyme
MAHMHLSFATPRLAEMRTFYSRLFDLEPDKVEVDYVRFTVANPPLVLALRPGPEAPLGVGVDHLGLRLPDTAAVKAARARLEAAGLAPFVEEAALCCYALQDKSWVADPDGRPWEVYTVLADADAMTTPDSGCCPTTAAEPSEPAAPSCCA